MTWNYIDYSMTPRTEHVSTRYGHRPRTASLRQRLKHGLAYFVTQDHELTPDPSPDHIGLVLYSGKRRKYQGVPAFVRLEDARANLALALSQS